MKIINIIYPNFKILICKNGILLLLFSQCLLDAYHNYEYTVLAKLFRKQFEKT